MNNTMKETTMREILGMLTAKMPAAKAEALMVRLVEAKRAGSYTATGRVESQILSRFRDGAGAGLGLTSDEIDAVCAYVGSISMAR